MIMVTFFTGFGVGFSLILAIGAQNAFVLKQGLKKQYIFSICFICALSDSILITIGTTGFAHLVLNYPQIILISKYCGALFLLLYGLKSFYSAFTQKNSLNPSEFNQSSYLSIILTCLAFTWLNPHVYLDTVLLMGSIATNFTDQLFLFTCGAITSSWLFFFSLGYGARFLLPLFQNPRSWQILDILIGVMMWAIALSLIL